MEAPPWATRKCGECWYYQPMTNDKQEYIGQGFCKRLPAQVLVVGESTQETMVQMAGAPIQKIKQVHINPYQPVMAHTWPACGEFRPMPEVARVSMGTNETTDSNNGGARA